MPDVTPAIAPAGRPGMRRFACWAALLVSLVVVLFQTLAPEPRRPVADATVYAAVDARLADAFRGKPSDGEPALGVNMAPLYHVFVAAVATVDDALFDALHCVKDMKKQCDLGGLWSLFFIQGLLGAATAFFMFMASLHLSGDMRVAWLALIIGLGSKIFSEYASQILTECLTFFFVFLFYWMFAKLLTARLLTEHRSLLCPALIAGAALALAALARPSYLYLVYFMVPVLGAWIYGTERDKRRALRGAGAFALGAGLFLLPWMARNYVVADAFALTVGLGARVLVERLAYNVMTWREWAISFVYWLPDFGDGLSKAVFDRADYIRLSWQDPDSFYRMGRGAFFNELWVAAGKQESHLPYLLKTYVFGDLFKHLAVTVAIAWRGMFVARYIGLVGFILLPFCWHRLRANGRGTAFLVFLLPGYFMLGLYAFVSVNVVRYNEPLICIFALSSAVFLVWLFDRISGRLRRAN